MARIKPFRAVRYDERAVGPLDRVVAPPYDVLSPEQRDAYAARSPHNVVRLTLPESEAAAAECWTSWLAEGALVRDAEPAYWWLTQDYVGPDGVARTREGLVCALRSEPYENRVVLPHERTHAGPKEGRLRLLRALRAHVEPIFLLYDGALAGPGGEPLLEIELDGVRNRLRPFRGDAAGVLADAQLLIADGHHRYETTLAFHAEDGSEESAWLMVVIVPTEQEGLTIFPTHRLVPPPVDAQGEPVAGDVDTALRSLAAEPRDRSAALLYRDGALALVRGEAGELDAALVARLVQGQVSYTAFAAEATAAVDRGDFGAAFLLRPPLIEEVQAVAGRGEVMPQKSTYFFPKLPSGVLFCPLGE